jgi:hypothetical protein
MILFEPESGVNQLDVFSSRFWQFNLIQRFLPFAQNTHLAWNIQMVRISILLRLTIIF